VEAVHLHQQLVEGLFSLLVGAPERRPALSTQGIDLVDEDDAGGVLLGVAEQVPDPRRSTPTNISTKSEPLREK